MKITQNNLQKLEQVAEECGYEIRYEKGNFQSGYCLLENKNIIVMNKFLPLEGRINAMQDILQRINVVFDNLSEESKIIYDKVQMNFAEHAEFALSA